MATKPSPRVSSDELMRMRRFSLACSVILLTYALAAVELDTSRTISPLGVPLLVKNPELLGIGLALAAFYGALRFAYYGLMLSDSPAARRRRELESLKIGHDYKASGTYNVPEQNRESTVEQFQTPFPHVVGAPIAVVLKYADDTARDVQDTLEGNAVAQVSHLEVPFVVRAAMLLEQLDYTSPVWFSAIAIGFWMRRFAL